MEAIQKGNVISITYFYHTGIAEYRAIIVYDNGAFTNCHLEEAEKVSKESNIKMIKGKNV